MARHHHRSHRHDDEHNGEHHKNRRHEEEDEHDRFEEEWERSDKHRRRHARFVVYLPYVVFTLIFIGIVFGAVYLFLTPQSEADRKRDMAKENTSSFTDRATAFKVLELMEAYRLSEAIALAETIAERIPGLERDVAHQITQKQGEVRRWLETYICTWINIEYATATQTTMEKRAGYPTSRTPEVVVFFLCDYANYRARNFAPAPREINDELLSRIFLQSADEKYRRLAARGEKVF